MGETGLGTCGGSRRDSSESDNGSASKAGSVLILFSVNSLAGISSWSSFVACGWALTVRRSRGALRVRCGIRNELEVAIDLEIDQYIEYFRVGNMCW